MTETPLRDAANERKRRVWLAYSIAGMFIEESLKVASYWWPWAGPRKGKAARMADVMLREYRERWERE